MVRPGFVVFVLVSLCLSAVPALADDSAESPVWWVRAFTEDGESRVRLLAQETKPADEVKPPDEVKPAEEFKPTDELKVTDELKLDPEARGRDWIGLSRDTALLLSYQVVGIAIIYALPESVSKWTTKDEVSFDQWWKNVTNPQWDQDAFAINYIGHPYFGATYYIRARERGFGRIESFVYSAFASALYEFGVEALFERPSYTDLIVTPVAGSLLGGFVFEPIRNWILHKPELRWYDHVGLVATDPIGALNYIFERLVGIKSDIRVGVPRGGGVLVELRVPWN